MPHRQGDASPHAIFILFLTLCAILVPALGNGEDRYASTAMVLSVSSNRRGDIVLVTRCDSQLEHWSAATHRFVRAIDRTIDVRDRDLYSRWLTCSAFSPDETQFAIGGADSAITIHSTDSFAQKTRLTGHTNWVLRVCYSPNGKLLASAARDRLVKVWDLQGGKATQSLVAHKNWVECVQFAPSGKRLASCGWDGQLVLWDTEKWEEKHRLAVEGSKALLALTFSPNDEFLAFGGQDNEVTVVKTDSFEKVASLPVHESVYSLDFIDSNTLLIGSHDGRITLWDISHKNPLRVVSQLLSSVHAVALSESKQVAVVGSVDGAINFARLKE